MTKKHAKLPSMQSLAPATTAADKGGYAYKTDSKFHPSERGFL